MLRLECVLLTPGVQKFLRATGCPLGTFTMKLNITKQTLQNIQESLAKLYIHESTIPPQNPHNVRMKIIRVYGLQYGEIIDVTPIPNNPVNISRRGLTCIQKIIHSDKYDYFSINKTIVQIKEPFPRKDAHASTMLAPYLRRSGLKM